MSYEFAAWIAGVYCPPLVELPKIRPAGTPRDKILAVPCPGLMPDGCNASWLTRVRNQQPTSSQFSQFISC